MAVGELDIAVQVDSTSAVAGFKRSAAEAQKFGKSMQTLGRDADAMSKKYAASMRTMAMASKQVTFQLSDITMMLASGVSPFAVMTTQTEQLGSALKSAGGGMGALRALGAGIMGLLNPTNLLIAGLILAGGTAVQMFMDVAGSESKAAEAALERHKAALEKIKALYPQIADEVAKANRKLDEAFVLPSAATEQSTAVDTFRADAAALVVEFEKLFAAGEQLRGVLSDETLAPAHDAIRNLLETGDFDAFVTELTAVHNALLETDPASAQSVAALIKVGQAYVQAGAAVGPFEQDIRDYIAVATDANSTTGDIKAALDTLIEKLRSTGATAPELQPLVEVLIGIAQNALNSAAGLNAADIAARNARAGFFAGAEGANALARALGNVASAASQASRYQGAVDRLRAGLNPPDERTQIESDYQEAIATARSQGAVTEAYELRAKRVEELNAREAEQLARENELQASAGRTAGAVGGVGGAMDANTQKVEAWAEAMNKSLDPMKAVEQEMQMFRLAVTAGLIDASREAEVYRIAMERAGLATKKTAEQGKEFGDIMQSWGQQVAGSLADAIVEGENLNDVFRDLLKTLLKMIIQMMILEPLMKSVMGGFGGMGAPAMGGGSWAPVGWYGRSMRALESPGTYTRGSGRSAPGSGHTVTNHTGVGGNLVVNVPIGQDIIGSGDRRAVAMAKRIKSVVQEEIVRQQRPGGLLWET